MGNTHSTGSSKSTRLSRKFSRQTGKGNSLPLPDESESKRVSLPPSPIHSSHPQQNNNNNNKKTEPTKTFTFHNRTYQKFNDKYILPSDELEQDRLVQVHFIYKHLFGDNFSAPVRDLLSMKQSRRNSASSGHQQWIQDMAAVSAPRVLDIACGTGTWIMEMATEFPESQFFGIDIAANYPTAIKPANTFFSQQDILQPKGLPYPDKYFDYIHMRQVYTCFSEEDWVTVIKEIKRLLKPGGYIELRDIDPMLCNMGPITQNFFSKFPHLMKEHHGVNILWARYIFDILHDVGDMADVHHQVNTLRFDTPGAIGNLAHNAFRLALQSYRLFFETHNNLPGADYDKVINDIVEETIKYNSYFNYHNCWGRKPLCDTAYHHQETVDYTSAKCYSSTTSLDNNQCTLNRKVSCASSTVIPRIRYNSDKSSEETTVEQVIEDEPKHANYFAKQHAYSVYPLEQQIVTLAEDNVTDIDRFAEGYED